MIVRNKIERCYRITHECDVEYCGDTWKFRFFVGYGSSGKRGNYYVLNKNLEVPRWVEGGFQPCHDEIYQIYSSGEYEEIIEEKQ